MSDLMPHFAIMIPTPADVAAVTAALAVARTAAASNDVPVGAVVLAPGGALIAQGCNIRERDQDPTGHAEIVALRAASAVMGSWRLEGTTLAVTLEPCPMCAGAAVQARVARIVFGAYDPKAGAVGSVWDLVRDPRATHRPEVVAGVLEATCRELLDDFFATARTATIGTRGDSAGQQPQPTARPAQ